MDIDTELAALEHEKAGYEAAGKADRAKACAASIKALGKPRTTSAAKAGGETADVDTSAE